MNLLSNTKAWVNGEVLQGKIMVAIGILVLIAFIAVMRSQQPFLKGMLIPMGLLLVVTLGYGGFQIFGRPAHLMKVEQVYQDDPKNAQSMEYKKAVKDDKAYTTAKKVWPFLIVFSALCCYILVSPYLKGLSAGLIGLFLTTLIVDTILHHRLLVYLEYLSKQQGNL